VQWKSEKIQDGDYTSQDPIFFAVLQISFCVFFTVELALRWAADGFLAFWYTREDGWNRELSWNAMDALIVFTGWIDAIAEIVSLSSADSGDFEGRNEATSRLSAIRVLRVLRIVRVARIIRVMRFFRELRMMVFSILGSMKSVFWVIAVLGMVFYIFGITFTSAVTDHRIARHNPNSDVRHRGDACDTTDDMVAYFGTLDKSIEHSSCPCLEGTIGLCTTTPWSLCQLYTSLCFYYLSSSLYSLS
jgi:hypothetical protein